MKKSILFLFLLIANIGDANLYDLSICAIFKNEGPYLKEWVEYHRCVGVQHFYLFNNNSTDDYYTVLKPYIDEGIVELEYAPDLLDFDSTQRNAYQTGLIKSSGLSTWVAFIDIDEFIMPTEDVNLVPLLSQYPDAGVAVNWRCFGTSHLPKLAPNEPMTSQLVRCTPDHHSNKFVKSIVRPEFVLFFWGPHNAIYHLKNHAVDVEKIPLKGPLSRTVKLDPLLDT